MTAVILNLNTVELTDEQFYRLCQVNRDWQLERTAKGELIIMWLVGGIRGNREKVYLPATLEGETVLPGFKLFLDRF